MTAPAITPKTTIFISSIFGFTVAVVNNKFNMISDFPMSKFAVILVFLSEIVNNEEVLKQGAIHGERRSQTS